MSVLLGIDIGTTATKALLLDTKKGVIAEQSRPVTLHSPQPGWAEEDPAEWWDNLCALTGPLAAAHDIRAVGISGMVPCVILIDDEGRVLRRSIQQNDARAIEQIAALRAITDADDILRRTGSAITQQSVAPKLMWLSQHEPDAWESAAMIAGSYDLMAYWLTGERTVERNWALESGLYDLTTESWADDILAAAEMKADRLPPIHQPHEIIGTITAEASKATGLTPGIPVVAGTADHVASAFATGLMQPGDLVVKLGGAGDILIVTDDLFVDPRLYLDYHLVPGRYLPNGCMATSGSLLRWFQQELAGGDPLSKLDAEAELAGPGAGGIVALPYFLGEKTPINDPAARGAFVGLHLGHKRGHIFRALLEGVAFGFRHHLDVFSERGITPSRVRVTNGGADSKLWTQITADVLGYPLEKVTVTGGSALGAAFVAGIGIDHISSWEAIEDYVQVQTVIEPEPSPIYDERYAIYRALYPALKNVLDPTSPGGSLS